VVTPAASAVTVSNCGIERDRPFLSGRVLRMIGLRNKMYAIVMNVVSPAMISVLTVDPRSVILK
jgi:hypothetical protein